MVRIGQLDQVRTWRQAWPRVLSPEPRPGTFPISRGSFPKAQLLLAAQQTQPHAILVLEACQDQPRRVALTEALSVSESETAHSCCSSTFSSASHPAPLTPVSSAHFIHESGAIWRPRPWLYCPLASHPTGGSSAVFRICSLHGFLGFIRFSMGFMKGLLFLRKLPTRMLASGT